MHTQDANNVVQIDTIVVGAGQAGLAMSYYLKQAGREHLVLEKGAQAAPVWQNERWDSFTFVTPNWSIRLPGAEYHGAYPDGYMPRREIVEYFQHYAAEFQLPIRYNVKVERVETNSDGGFMVKTAADDYAARNVIIATGSFQIPRVPEFAANLPEDVLQLHSSQYRNPQQLPQGAVLVVGSAQSGSQITEELYQGGRTVYLSVGSAGRALRRYRGKDVWEWLKRVGFLDRPVESLPNSRARFDAVPHLSGTRGGHAINLHRFARDGVHLLGHLNGVQDGKLLIAPNLMENLARADRFEAEQIKLIDAYIARSGIDAPEESVPILRDGFDAPLLSELDLRQAGIRTVIWATGYRFDFSWVKPAELDQDGFPVQQRGVMACPGLYFVGLPWQNTLKTGLVIGVGEVAAHIAEEMEKEKVSSKL